MLFDLQGKRRRVVQGTYLGLAVLMGAGLVLTGIGSDVSGGLLDAFKGGSNNTGTNTGAIEKRVKRSEARLRVNPRNQVALRTVVRDRYQLATAKSDPGSGTFPKDSRADLAAAAAAWQRYLKLTDKPNPSLASTAFQVYDVNALNRPKDATNAAVILAQATPRAEQSAAYIRVVQYATLAKDTRTAGLAGQKAIDVAPKGSRKEVAQQVKQAKTPQPAGGAAGGQGTAPGG